MQEFISRFALMKKQNNLALGISEPEKVAAYLDGLDHPLKDLAEYLRSLILAADPNIGEGIYWNAPTFFFTGAMPDFDPKTYKRYIVGFNFYRKDAIRLIFLHGARANNDSGLLEGDYPDGRRIVTFTSIEAAKANKKALGQIIQTLVAEIGVI